MTRKAAVLVRTFDLAQRLVFEHVFADEPQVGDLVEMAEATADGQVIADKSAMIARITHRIWLREGDLAYLATEEAAQVLAQAIPREGSPAGEPPP